MTRIVMLVMAITAIVGFTSCMEGPAGKDGEPGEDGKSVVIASWTGILYPSQEKKDSGFAGYWDISDLSIREDRVVSVYVRQGAGYMWREPTWLLGDGYIRIGNDDKADPSFEYRITVGR
ncbi:MAG TPA: hypothetical protein VK465_14490 [Fibrobacteria bacterium]|nr:hypothetical protein [Fibrobacteria bacterium]